MSEEHACTSGLLLPREMFPGATVGKGWEQSKDTEDGKIKYPVPAAPPGRASGQHRSDNGSDGKGPK